MSWWGSLVRGLTTRDAAEAPPEDAGASPSPPSPYQSGVEAVRRTSTWLVGALAAVAAALAAALTFSGLGRLSLEDDRLRLLVAVVALVVAFGGIAVAILLLVAVQRPVSVGLPEVRDAVAPDGPMRSLAAADRGYAAGFEDPAAMVARYDTLRAVVWDAEAEARTTSEAMEALLASRPAPPVDQVEAAQAAVVDARARVAQLLELTDEEYTKLAAAVGTLGEHRQYDLVVRQSRLMGGWAVVAAVVAGAGIVVFAWAGNPPEGGGGGAAADALAPAPSAAVLTLSTAGAAALEATLSPDCRDAATGDGLPVVALAAEGRSFDLVVVPSGDCPDPVRFTLAPGAGELDPAAAVDVSP